MLLALGGLLGHCGVSHAVRVFTDSLIASNVFGVVLVDETETECGIGREDSQVDVVSGGSKLESNPRSCLVTSSR